MSNAPVTHIDPAAFTADPYPVLAQMRAKTPITFVPELGATLLTRRDDIHREEKRIEVFSSVQPGGLMEQIMGLNMMRRDGEPHGQERRALFPALSPRTVADHWAPQFEQIVTARLDQLAPLGGCDLVRDFAMPVSGAALCAMTGLTCMTPEEMDSASQQMIDAIANYAANPQIEATGLAASTRVDDAIAECLPQVRAVPDPSILSVLDRAEMPLPSIAANIKVIIGGGQNEPRDAIAGLLWALLAHPDQRALITSGDATLSDAFSEYARLVAPIQMAPRMVARRDTVAGVTFEPGDRVFLMFGSACRDEDHFANADQFDLSRDTSAAIPFGAGPHFCAGAAASRSLVAHYAVPMILERFPQLRLAGPVPFAGWAFRGPTSVPVTW
ncbi:cytochrome P450 [Sulfitobacter mediterraneus]|uniref:cytochrome P450 n=1 Tax=Sulfitobacter mediterraneus TaxID=83219 RepID=UPI001932F2E8|nr:cytochrome P450 [Sulfitobacter mediterraneus]MBM1631897.1 cytochrome P450 [Sulfitobacter mediterraneus]MBM1639712.1 cytochrome P450 [Sulfitobacter mediterraneus]MBM1643761.1 cytochrome P450 [Sulfitobacter mediterraneus]MBM1647807.1 cytochrome P450 [Sulfitobacter mediterraneus]MBM1651852.1 cytochrome P450 [Sulfitobacter mediterraneus]